MADVKCVKCGTVRGCFIFIVVSLIIAVNAAVVHNTGGGVVWAHVAWTAFILTGAAVGLFMEAVEREIRHD
jgi:drug/metabolite transporter (DMT)-like permease